MPINNSKNNRNKWNPNMKGKSTNWINHMDTSRNNVSTSNSKKQILKNTTNNLPSVTQIYNNPIITLKDKLNISMMLSMIKANNSKK